ncbi:MAG: hypothetical protein V1652_02390 [bacterium]
MKKQYLKGVKYDLQKIIQDLPTRKANKLIKFALRAKHAWDQGCGPGFDEDLLTLRLEQAIAFIAKGTNMPEKKVKNIIFQDNGSTVKKVLNRIKITPAEIEKAYIKTMAPGTCMGF